MSLISRRTKIKIIWTILILASAASLLYALKVVWE
jgi:hypothetical protein